MTDIGCIILAAGANERLKGLVPSFMKPLILVNGKPLISHAIQHATRDWKVMSLQQNLAIVAAPQNVGAIAQIVGNHLNYVVQPYPLGVMDAIKRAAPFMTKEWTLILMGDNTFEGEVPDGLSGADGAIATREVSNPQRFTRLDTRNRQIFSRDSNQEGDAVWIGPLILRTELLKANLLVENIELLIHVVTDGGRKLYFMPMHCSDLGVPEELNGQS